MQYREHRWPCRYPVLLERRGVRVRALLGNIAGAGALVIGVGDAHIGERLVLLLPKHSLAAEVRWARGNRCGVRFATPLPAEEVARIRRIVGPAHPVRSPGHAGLLREMR